MTSKAEQILQKLKTLFEDGCDASVQLDDGLPDDLPADGLITIFDGDPGEPDEVLGGFAQTYYEHEIEIVVYAGNGNPDVRRAVYDAAVRQIGVVLEAHPDLDGLVEGMIYGRPEGVTEPIEGAPSVKAGAIVLKVEYQTDTPLS